MKSPFLVLLLMAAMFPMARAEEPMLPPNESCGEWAELQKQKFSEWRIEKFLGWAVAADGGSKGFFFESDAGERFDLLAANPAYWTALEKQERRQVFFLIYKNRFYRIDPGSEQEKNLIEKLTLAAGRLAGEGRKDPKLLSRLAERLKNRSSVPDPKLEQDSHGKPASLPGHAPR